MIVRFVTDWKSAEDQTDRSILLSWTAKSVESVTMTAAEFRSNRSLVIVRPERPETWMAIVLFANAPSDTVTFSEGRSTHRAAPAYQEGCENESREVRL